MSIFNHPNLYPFSRLGIAVLLGGLLPLSLAPYNLFYLSFLIPGALWWLLASKSSITLKQTFWIGWAFGVGVFGVGASWVYVSIHDYGYTSVFLAAVLTGLFVITLGLFFALQCSLYVKCVQKTVVGSTLDIFLYSSSWVLFEWIRSWFLGGFPWVYIGYSQIDTSIGKGFAPLGGIFLVSWLVVNISVLIFVSLVGCLKKRLPILSILPAAAVIAFIAIGSLLLEKISWTKEVGEPLSVVLIQPNVPQNLKWSDEALINILKQNLEMTEPYWESGLILWPENAIPLFSDFATPYLNVIAHNVRTSKSVLMTGIPIRRSPNAKYFNGILMIGPSTKSYSKHHLVPFGEFVPLEKILRGAIEFFNLPMSNFSAGSANQLPLENSRLKIGPSICYEIAYPAYIAEMAKKSNLLVTVSNDTWFGKSMGPHQHFQIARMRALETGKYLLRGTNNGITAIIDHHGMVQTSAPQFKKTTLLGTAYLTEGATPYVQYQNVPILLILFFVIGIVLVPLCAIHLYRRSPQVSRARQTWHRQYRGPPL